MSTSAVGRPRKPHTSGGMDAWQVLQHTIWDIGLLAGAALVPLLTLYLFQRIGGWALRVLGGNKTFLAFSWVGVPVHELSHAAMATLFAHQVIDIKLLETNHVIKQLGWVRHRWNPLSLYQSAGLFLIGLAPLVGGGLLIWLFTHWLLPTQELLHRAIHLHVQHFGQAGGWQEFLWIGGTAYLHTLDILLLKANLSNPLFWGFIYLGGSVALHMRPSTPDWIGSATGLGYVLIILLILRAGLELLGISGGGIRATFHWAAAWLGTLLTLAAAVGAVLVMALLVLVLLQNFGLLPATNSQ